MLVSLGCNYFTSFTTPFIIENFQRIFARHPALESELKKAQDPSALKDFLQHCAGVIEADGGTGSIDIDRSFLEALRAIRFDHQDGHVGISNSWVVSSQVELGGNPTATGQTDIGGNTRLRGGRAGIDIGAGGGMKITGDAKLKIG